MTHGCSGRPSRGAEMASSPPLVRMAQREIFAAWLLLAVGCDSEDSGEASSGDTGGSTASTGVAEGSNTSSETGGQNDADTGGQSGDDAGECEAINPEGQPCADPAECNVECICQPTNIEAGYCIDGECASPDVVCTDVCGEDDYSGQFCSL